MSLETWLLRHGAIGGATRLFIKAYLDAKAENPNAPDKDLFLAIAEWRFSLTGAPVKAKNFNKICQCETPKAFITRLVMTERWNVIKKSPHLQSVTKKVIHEICEENGIKR